MASVMSEDAFKKCKENYIYQGFKSIDYLYKNQLFCDLTLVSKDGMEFKLHKCVVYSASGYFKGLYQSDMKESVADRINLDFVSGNILEHIIMFMYEAELKTNNAEVIEEIAEKADYLQIKQLRDMCLLLLLKSIDDSNCLKLWRLITRLSAEELEDTCIVYIFKFAERLFENSEFLNDLSVDEMKQLLLDSRLPLSEDSVFKYALGWARDDIAIFDKVIDCIRFPFLRKKFILSDVFTNKLLMQKKNVMEKINECAKYKWTVETGDEQLSSFPLPRIGLRHNAFLAVLGSKMIQISNSGEIENPQNDVEYQRRDFGYTTFYHNLLFICGGRINGLYTNTCEYYSTITGKFTSYPPFKTGRRNPECSLIDDKIYVCGGYESKQSVEIFDLGIEKWTKGPLMTSARYRFGLTSMNRSLYAIGGCENKSVEFLDPRSSNSWTIINDAFSKYNYTQCVSIGTEIYCFRTNDHVYIFDTSMNKLRRMDSGYDEMINNGFYFKVCELVGDFGIILPHASGSKLIKYNARGDVLYKKQLNMKSHEEIECLSTFYN